MEMIRIGRKGKGSYISAVEYEIKINNNNTVKLSAVGKRLSTLVAVVHDCKPFMTASEWNTAQTEINGYELSVILTKKEN